MWFLGKRFRFERSLTEDASEWSQEKERKKLVVKRPCRIGLDVCTSVHVSSETDVHLHNNVHMNMTYICFKLRLQITAQLEDMT